MTDEQGRDVVGAEEFPAAPTTEQLYEELRFRNEKVRASEKIRSRLWEQRREVLTELRERGESLSKLGDFLGVHKTMIHRLTKPR